jgi:transposase
MGEGAVGNCAEAERTERICRPAVEVANGTGLAWLCRNRRLRCDYERLPQTTEALIYVAMIRLMTRRLAAS